MRLVVIESPLAGDFKRNIRYARLCMIDSLRRGEAPYASHLLYPQVLDDKLPEDRALGMTAGFAWAARGDAHVAYVDLGISGGMKAGREKAEANGVVWEERNPPADLLAQLDRTATLDVAGTIDLRMTEGIR